MIIGKYQVDRNGYRLWAIAIERRKGLDDAASEEAL